MNPLFPALRKRTKVILVSPVGNIALTRERGRATISWIHPSCLLIDVIDEEDSAIGSNLHGPTRGKAFEVQVGGRRFG